MHFVKRSGCPALLTKNKELWTQPWIDYTHWQAYGPEQFKQPSKPGSHWRKDGIRLILIADFYKNCGYCGSLILTPVNDDDDKEIAGKGDVDHFLAKSFYPELSYEWTNYIWSCKACNQHKGDFNDQEYPLLNPCSQPDCEQLTFIEDSGKYVLRSDIAANKYWQQRFNNTDRKTLINSEICDVRRDNILLLRGCFESISRLLPNLTKLAALQIEIDCRLVDIQTHINAPTFHFLLQASYQSLLLEYPQVAALINKS